MCHLHINLHFYNENLKTMLFNCNIMNYINFEYQLFNLCIYNPF